jgi:hypothetical protein
MKNAPGPSANDAPCSLVVYGGHAPPFFHAMKPPSIIQVARALAVLAVGVVVVMAAILGVVLIRDPLPAKGAPAAGPRLEGLPLVEVVAGPPSGDALMVYYTGDNGWQDGDQAFTAAAARSGLPVVAIDSLHYFIRARSPQGAAADLAAIIDRYSAQWRARRIVLVGYSFGADALPLIARRLPPRLRARVSLIALIGPGGRGELTLRPHSLLSLTGPGAQDVLPALRALGGTPAICVYAAADGSAACPDFPDAVIHAVRTPGGHRLMGNYQAVADIVAAAACVDTQSTVQPLPSGAVASPSFKARCIKTTSTQRPRLKPTERSTPAIS